jgi:protocatechuate 3,4-dioxygenase beta subunit
VLRSRLAAVIAAVTVVALTGGIAQATDRTDRPAPVRHAHARHVSSSRLVLKWTNPAADSFRRTVIRMRPGRSAPAGPEGGSAVASVGKTHDSLAVHSLLANTTYTFALFAMDDSARYSRAAIVRATTKPAAVRDVQAYLAGKAIILDWTNPPAKSFARIVGRYQRGAAAPTMRTGRRLALGSAKAHSVTLHHLAVDTTYSVSLWTVGADGQRAAPATMSFTTSDRGGVPTGTYRGTVTDSAGDPLQGVAVALGDFLGGGSETTTTDAAGKFDLTLPVGEYIVEFDASQATGGSSDSTGYQGDERLVHVVGSSSPHADIVLRTGAALAGRVTDTTGNPLAGVRAYLAPVSPYVYPDTGNGGIFVSFAIGPLASTMTSADGTYTLRGAPDAALQVCFARGSATLDAFGEAITCTDQSFDPRRGSTTAVADEHMETSPIGAIAGTVTNAAGQGVAGVAVEVSGSESGLGFVQTDSAGHYEIDGIAPGSYQVCDYGFTQPATAPTGYLDTCAAGKATVHAGKVTTVNLRVRDGAAVMGKVTASSGRPLAGVGVSAFRLNRFGGDQLGYATSDAHGHYLIKGLPRAAYRICFDPTADTSDPNRTGSAGACYHGRVAVRPGAIRTGIDQRLSVGGAVAGVVTNADGTPHQLADVSVESARFGGDDTVYTDVPTDKHGHYRVTGLGSGAYRVCVLLLDEAGPQREYCHPGTVRVTAGRTARVNERLPALSSVNVMVHDSDGTPVPGVDLAVLKRCTRDPRFECDHVASFDPRTPVSVAASAVTGRSGAIDFRQLKPGKYTVCAFAYYGTTSANGSPPAGYADKCDSTSLNITTVAGKTRTRTMTLPHGGAVTGRVTDADGHPLRGVIVHVSNSAADDFHGEFDDLGLEGGPGASSVTGSDGTYTVRSVAVGEQTVCVDASQAKGGTSAAGYLDQCHGGTAGTGTGGTPVSVSADTATSVSDLMLTGAAGIAGTVTSDNGGRVKFTEVIAFDASDKVAADVLPSSHGKYKIIGLIPGSYRVCFDSGAQAKCYDNVRWNAHNTPPANATPVSTTAGAITKGIDATLHTP